MSCSQVVGVCSSDLLLLTSEMQLNVFCFCATVKDLKKTLAHRNE